jgi:hypothetical protein
MKAITMRIQKFSRPGVILLAIVVVIVTSMVAANATQTITTPNAAFISYSLGAGANSAPITPTTNRSVVVMGCGTGPSQNSVGHVSLLHIPGGGMTWAGLESYSGSPSTITSGYSNSVGIHIVYIDYQHLVEIQVNSADTIRVHSRAAGGTATGNVTFIW